MNTKWMIVAHRKLLSSTKLLEEIVNNKDNKFYEGQQIINFYGYTKEDEVDKTFDLKKARVQLWPSQCRQPV